MLRKVFASFVVLCVIQRVICDDSTTSAENWIVAEIDGDDTDEQGEVVLNWDDGQAMMDAMRKDGNDVAEDGTHTYTQGMASENGSRGWGDNITWHNTLDVEELALVGERLKNVLQDLARTDEGFIVRTAAENATQEEIEQDAGYLRAKWQMIREQGEGAESATVNRKQNVVRLFINGWVLVRMLTCLV